MERHSLAVLVNQFDVSQMTICMVHNINELCQRHNVLVFYNEMSDFMFNNKFSILPMREMYTFNGIAISTCEYTTKQLLNSFCTKKRLFYIWDFEWNEFRDYNKNCNLYMDDSIELIGRSKYHKKLIEHCWKKATIIEDFDHEQIERLLNKS